MKYMQGQSDYKCRKAKQKIEFLLKYNRVSDNITKLYQTALCD